MKRIFTIFLILLSVAAHSQYNNSWIDYNKTYFKFKVATTGLYRISYASLNSMGLAGVPVENLQLWRNGEEVTLYTSVATGVPGASDYVEFWGEKNDGRPDKALYRKTYFQHTDKHSLYTDSVSFFLTVNAAGNNKRFTPVANDVSAPAVPRENSFMYTWEEAYKERMTHGYAADVGEYVYSSSYDQGEFWATNNIGMGGSVAKNFTNLYPYTSGADVTIKIGAAGVLLKSRRVKVNLNNNQLLDKSMPFMSDSVYTMTVPASSLSSGSAEVRVVNGSTDPLDRMAVSFISITYPREFKFDNTQNFTFNLPASASGNYLEISNFNHNGVTPVMYDLTNRTRYEVNIQTPGVFKVMLAPSSVPRKLIMVSQGSSNIRAIPAATQRNFVNYFNAANQGDYIIISNPLLEIGASGNPVEEYRNYRRSIPGGGYNAAIYNINELEDQFGFGINKHPLSIKNFLAFARASFAVKPKFVLLMGRGVNYNAYYAQQAKPEGLKMNLIPTFGNPGSDNFLSAEGTEVAVPLTPIGRLAVVNKEEIYDYLNKVKQYELAQQTPSCSIADKAWMKNVVQVTGASDNYLGTVLCNYMNGYRLTLQDSLFGAKIHTFCKSSTSIGRESATAEIAKLFEEGISILNYFGHSSASILEFNINDPETYNNGGKYPVFFVNGCNAGNFFAYDVTRLGGNKTLTEKFNLAKEKGSIAFVASTHFGIVSYLNIYIDALYKAIGKTDYGASLGKTHVDAMQRIITIAGADDYYGRMHVEQITVHGDPAIKMNVFDQPDYVIEEPQVKVSPSFLSIAETRFEVDVKIHNIGKTSGDSLLVKIMRERPNKATDTLLFKKLKPISSADSIHLIVPIIATVDKGISKIIVQLDPENSIPEICENNNSIAKEVVIYEDEARPVYPYSFSIVNKPLTKFVASTSNPFGAPLDYKVEVDTTELFNSSLLRQQTVTASGGILEFNPAVPYMDSTVYYWRTAVVPKDGSDYKWSSSSFVYIPNSEMGWSQSHYFQWLKNTNSKIEFNDKRKAEFSKVVTGIKFFMALYTAGPEIAPITYINDAVQTLGACGSYLNSILYMAYDKKTGKQILNTKVGNKGLYNSLNPVCPANGITVNSFFYYSFMNASSRKLAIEFLDSIQNNTVIAIWNVGSTNYNNNTSVFADQWKADTLVYGTSLYHRYKDLGINEIDKFDKNLPFLFLVEKDENGNFKVLHQQVGEEAGSTFIVRYDVPHFGNNGTVQTLETGESFEWKSLHWDSEYGEGVNRADQSEFVLVGVKNDFSEDVLYKSNKLKQDTTLNFIDPTMYRKLKLQLVQLSTISYVPRQLKYWQIKYKEVPEGALSANISFSTRDTVDIGEKVDFNIAFKNISQTSFDSLKLKMLIIDKNNVTHTLAPARLDSLRVGESAILKTEIDTRKFPGMNTVYLEVNPDNDQPEEHHFNNFLFRNLYVRPDETNPLLDVTFDGMHILNKDIVSAKPHIAIKLKDDAKFMPLSDTAGVTVTLRYMESGGWVRTYKVDGDTLRFTPAANAQTDNTALLDFTPFLQQDGEYELTVSGKDRSENSTGNMEYKVVFQTFNKPMISNMLNYPNPFTTSTAFVFTITGSEIPQNIRIQILTVTGKVVREITKAELGDLRIGRNITDFKWDGTDQYGQKLANGIYLYRVITNLNGKSLDKFTSKGDKTDQFFNNGYGKMYLMR